jgi:hypothetical protein
MASPITTLIEIAPNLIKIREKSKELSWKKKKELVWLPGS